MIKSNLTAILSVAIIVLFFITGLAFGEDALDVSATGRVGIGTVTPGARLEIADNGYTSSVLFNIKSDDMGPWSLNLRQDSAAQDWGMYIDNSDNLHLYDRTDSRDVMIWDGSGNVGIGATTPTATVNIGQPLLTSSLKEVQIGSTSVSSVVRLGQASDRNGYIAWIYNATPENAYLNISTWAGGNNIVIANNGGNVGIGDTSPSYILDVLQGSATDPHADSWQVHSSRTFKGNIRAADITPDFIIPTYTYQVKKKIDGKITEELSDKQNFGIMAEDAPEIIRGDSGDDINLYAFTTYNYELIKTLKKEITELEEVMTTLETENHLIKTELCKENNSYSFCKGF